MFFIYDCNHSIVGNPNGYKTMAAAQSQANNPKSRAYKGIWAAYDERQFNYEKTCMPIPLMRRNISSIKLNQGA